MFPNSYDDDSVLLGDLQDQKSLILSQACADVDTTLFFESVVGLAVPTYLRLEDELVYVTDSDPATSSLTVERPANAASHLLGTAAIKEPEFVAEVAANYGNTGENLRNRAREHVGRTAGAIRHDELDRLLGIRSRGIRRRCNYC